MRLSKLDKEQIEVLRQAQQMVLELRKAKLEATYVLQILGFGPGLWWGLGDWQISVHTGRVTHKCTASWFSDVDELVKYVRKARA